MAVNVWRLMFVFANATWVALLVAPAAKITIKMDTNVNIVNDILFSYSSVSGINNFFA